MTAAPSRLTDVPGILVGHWTDAAARTGCTVILFPPGTTGGVEVSGGAPATRDTRLLDAGSSIDEVHGLVFAGGSAFGLDAAGGVMRHLERLGIGHATSAGIVPIVPAASIYDLNRGDASVRPGPTEGELAARSAAQDFAVGPVGAGTGASCAKWLGVQKAVPAGLGTAAVSFGGIIVGALAVVNPVGDIVDENGKVLLGHGAAASLRLMENPEATLLVAVATNGLLDRAQCLQAARRIQDGIARSVVPCRTRHDGDAGFFFSCGRSPADLDIVFALTADVTAAAIRSVAGQARSGG
jgi:L-aminopeptidase/D-esterase-like protein